MSLDSMQDLFVEELRDLYHAENQLIKALPKMAKAASAPELKTAFEEHLEVTREQVVRLEEIFKDLDLSPKGKVCKAMLGLIEEGKEIIEEDGEPAVKDAALIAAAQRVEHYEMPDTDASGRLPAFSDYPKPKSCSKPRSTKKGKPIMP